MTDWLSEMLAPDAALAVLAIEHGLGVASAHSDFALRELRRENPIRTARWGPSVRA